MIFLSYQEEADYFGFLARVPADAAVPDDFVVLADFRVLAAVLAEVSFVSTESSSFVCFFR